MVGSLTGIPPEVGAHPVSRKPVFSRIDVVAISIAAYFLGIRA